MIKNLRTLFFIFLLNMRQSFYYKGGAVAVTITWAFRVGITALLYTHIYKLLGVDQIKGVSLDVAISGMMFFAIYSLFSGREIPKRMTAENKSGGIEVWFSKPVPYLLLKLGEVWGKNVPSFIGIVVVSFLYWMTATHHQHIDQEILRLFCAVLLLFGGALISVMLYMLVALSAIFLVESRAINYIVDKLIMLFGGIYIPIAFFPTTFRTIAETFPTTAATFGAQFLYLDFFDNLSRFIAVQFFWIVVLYGALVYLNRLAHAHLTVNGG
jgi:ABC-2 type transport system permease protein